MKENGIGAMLLMYDENVRYVTSTLTPGWNRLKPGLRYAMLCGDGAPVLFEQGDIGTQIERHAPWIPPENVRYSYAWIKGAAGPASTQQVKKFIDAAKYEMKRHGVEGEKLGVDRKVLFDIMSTSSANSWVLNNVCPLPSGVPNVAENREFKPGFAAKLMLKDLRLSQAAAQMSGSATPLGAAAAAAYQQHINNGHGDLDNTSICKLIDPEIE